MKIQLSVYPICEKEFFSNVSKLDSSFALYRVGNSRLIFSVYCLFKKSLYLCFVVYLKILCNVLYEARVYKIYMFQLKNNKKRTYYLLLRLKSRNY